MFLPALENESPCSFRALTRHQNRSKTATAPMPLTFMPPDKEVSPMPDIAKPTVLVVDDATDIRTMLRLWLERSGCRVVEAADGKQAVRVAAREHPALILMDL